MESVEVRLADLSNPADQKSIVRLVDAYARDPMGKVSPLDEEVAERLIPGLSAHPTTRIFLAERNGEQLGIAVCFIGFSTFAAQPLINIHDLFVLPEYRGQRVGRRLLETVEGFVKANEFWGMTLEVDQHNQRARKTYQAAGFLLENRVDGGGKVFFMKKPASS